MTDIKRYIGLLSAAIVLTGTLAACTSADRPDCWKANTKTVKDCNSSGNGGFSMSNSSIKSKRSAPKDTSATPAPETPSHSGANQNDPAQDNSLPNDGDSEPNVPDQDTDVSQPNQLNSNDIKGFDPFGGLYGPGT